MLPGIHKMGKVQQSRLVVMFLSVGRNKESQSRVGDLSSSNINSQ
jgi:hypothetical protein